MIDWITAVIPLRHKRLARGQIISVDADGVEEWASYKKFVHEGTHSTKIFLKSQGADSDGFSTHLYVDGNPIKLLTGQNAYGTEDIGYLMVLFMKKIFADLDIPYTIFDLWRIRCGAYDVKRIDIARHYTVGSQHEDVRRFIDAMDNASGTKFRKAYVDKGSAYFNKGSKRWSVVFYDKLKEVQRRDKDGKLHLDPHEIRRLKVSLHAQVRCELRLKAQQLKEHTNESEMTGDQLTPEKLDELYATYIGRCQMNSNIRLADTVEAKLPNKLRSTYLLWKQGEDLRSIMSPATFFRHKADLKAYGINIDIRQAAVTSNVVPLIRIIEAKPVSTPDFIKQERYWLQAV